MGLRKVTVRLNAADNIASIGWFIEAKGMVKTADKFIDGVYDYFVKLSDDRKSYADCRDAARKMFGYKCISYKKKYTVVFIESDTELIICEFMPSKLIV